MGNDNFILSDRQNICNLELKEKRDFECYSNINELFEKIEYYMSHEDERNRIARNGGQLIREKYNLVNTLKLIFS